MAGMPRPRRLWHPEPTISPAPPMRLIAFCGCFARCSLSVIDERNDRLGGFCRRCRFIARTRVDRVPDRDGNAVAIRRPPRSSTARAGTALIVNRATICGFSCPSTCRLSMTTSPTRALSPWAATPSASRSGWADDPLPICVAAMAARSAVRQKCSATSRANPAAPSMHRRSHCMSPNDDADHHSWSGHATDSSGSRTRPCPRARHAWQW